MSQFIYLLNAMENAAQAADPSTAGYGLKRRAVLEYVEKLESSPPEAEGEAEHLRMQIGYIATELMVRGDPRSLPEIVETAAKATRPGRSPSE
jgi:hypothetical protein